MNKRQQKKLKRAIAVKLDRFEHGGLILMSVFTGREMGEINRLKQSWEAKFDHQIKKYIGKEVSR